MASASPGLGARLGTFAIGVLLKKLTDALFDYGLYPLALIGLGYACGAVAMTALSVAVNLLAIRAYDWAGRDLLLIESLKDLKTCQGGGFWSRRLSAVLRAGDVPAFVLLSWLEDALVVTLYLRKGSYLFNGLSRRDWMVFVGATVLSNLLWILSLISLIELMQIVWAALGSLLRLFG
jgi:hypothetical protein